jgi:hypothetical protein
MDALQKTVGHVKEELLPDVDFDQFDQESEDNLPVKTTEEDNLNWE